MARGRKLPAADVRDCEGRGALWRREGGQSTKLYVHVNSPTGPSKEDSGGPDFALGPSGDVTGISPPIVAC